MVAALLVSTAALVSSTEAPAVSLSSTTCRPAVRALNVELVPQLFLVKQSDSLGTCPDPIKVMSRGPDGALWGTDSNNGLWRSTDEMATWQLMYRAVDYYEIQNVLQLADGHVLIEVLDHSGNYHVLRSGDTQGRVFSSTPVFSFPPPPSAYGAAVAFSIAPRLLGSESWAQIGNAIYIGEYGDLLPTVYLWKSTDDGRSFSVAASFTGVRHIHCVFADPYVPGRVWVTIGDDVPAPRIGYSDDGGGRFTFITQGKYPESRAIGLMFTEDAVYWATDSPEVPAGLYRWDRATGAVTKVLGALNGPFYFSVSWHGMFAVFSEVASPSRDEYHGDNWIHVLVSPDSGRTWATAPTPWSKSPDDPAADRKAVAIGITTADSDGRFWMSIYDLSGAVDQISNVEVQFRAGACPSTESGSDEPAVMQRFCVL